MQKKHHRICLIISFRNKIKITFMSLFFFQAADDLFYLHVFPLYV